MSALLLVWGVCGAIIKTMDFCREAFFGNQLHQGYPSVNHSIKLWDGKGVDTFAVSETVGL